MTPSARRWVFLVGAGRAGRLLLCGACPGCRASVDYPGPYGFIINRVTVAQTNATGVVSAVNFEYRGFDTVGEEFILFAAVAGHGGGAAAPARRAGRAGAGQGVRP